MVGDDELGVGDGELAGVLGGVRVLGVGVAGLSFGVLGGEVRLGEG